MAHLRSLHLYPLKSAGGIAVAHADVDERGLRLDRRWLIVDGENRFLTQRSHPRMALLRTALPGAGPRTGSGAAAPGVLRVTGPGMDALDLPIEPADGAPRQEPVERIPVWGIERWAVSCGEGPAQWASDYLGLRCRVVRAAAPPRRPRVDGAGRVHAGFADAYPALVVATASLADLNARLAEPLPMDRFRPGLVVDGVPAYDEDRWERVRVGAVTARGAKPCFRCAITTTDQETGVRGVEPLRTLATYRRAPDGEVAFGMNLVFEGSGVLRVGDPVTVAG